MSIERQKLVLFEFISKNIDLCSFDDKVTILTEISIKIGKSKIHDSADSSNIYLDDIPIELLSYIKKFIEEGNTKNKIDFTDVIV